MECSVCLDAPVRAHYLCGHANCLACYDLLRENNVTCPLCRQPLSLRWIDGSTEVVVKTFDRTAVLWVDLERTTWQCVANMMTAKWKLDWRPRLLLSGKSYSSERTLGSCGCVANDTIHIFLSLRGD